MCKQNHIKRILGGKGDVVSDMNAGLVGPIVCPAEHTTLENRTKICRADLGREYTFENERALEAAGYDDDIKKGMYAAHQGNGMRGIPRGNQVYPEIRASMLPFPLEIVADKTVVVADDFWVEACLHEKFADKRYMSEWFKPVTPEEVCNEANKWRRFTHAAHINIHNPHATAILAICAAHDGKGLSGNRGGKGHTRKRRLSEFGAGSELGSHDYGSVVNDDAGDDDASDDFRF